MTFSIVAFDAATGDLGVAVASKFPCVGAVVPWARAGVGAVATQSWANTDFGPDGLGLMGGGLPAGAALDAVLEPDADREERQVGFVDAEGGVATFTGANCMDWAGGRTGDGFAVQGNILAGEDVVAVAGRTCSCGPREISATGCSRRCSPVTPRAGTGGASSRRPCSSCETVAATRAATTATSTCAWTTIPTRRPSSRRVFGVWDTTMLVRTDEPLAASIELVGEVQRRLAAVGAFDAEASGALDDATTEALAEWAGRYNLEGRLRDDGMLSSHLVAELRDVTPDVS